MLFRSTIGGGGVGNASAGWTVAGVADFDDDGMADILWRHTNGNVAIWRMDGAAVRLEAGVANVSQAWAIQKPPAQ